MVFDDLVRSEVDRRLVREWKEWILSARRVFAFRSLNRRVGLRIYSRRTRKFPSTTRALANGNDPKL